MVIALMMKLLWNCDADYVDGGELRANEASALLPPKVEGWFISYGTSEEDDIESVFNRSCNSSSDDLYDGKICVICFDNQRSCLFVPCGHCITCYNCAKRYDHLLRFCRKILKFARSSCSFYHHIYSCTI